MKKQLFKKTVLCLFSLLFFSCAKDILEEKSSSVVEFSAKQIEQYYDTLKVNKAFQISGRSLKLQDFIQPDWNGALNAISPAFQYMEVPISLSKKEIIAYELDAGKTQNSQLRFQYSFSTLLFFKKANAEIQTNIITYIPNESYIKQHKKPINKNRINALDNIFSGYIEYKDLHGNVKQLAKIENGAMVQMYNLTAKGKSSKSDPTFSMASCQEVCLPRYQEICVGQIGTGFPEDYTCYTTIIGQDCFTICTGGGEDVPTPTNPGNPNPGDNPPPVDPLVNNRFKIDECDMVLDEGSVEFDEGEPLPPDYDPQQNQPKPKINHRYVSPRGTIFTEWTDNSGRIHLHAKLDSWYIGFFQSYKTSLLAIGANVSTIFEMFNEGKFVWPTSWAGIYSAEAEYIYEEMGEYYKDKKERNKQNGGSPCKK